MLHVTVYNPAPAIERNSKLPTNIEFFRCKYLINFGVKKPKKNIVE